MDTRTPPHPAGTGLPLATLTTITLLVSWLLLPPWMPSMPSAGLDPSWTAVLSHAFNHQWQFGTDVVLTYGPYGFLSTNLFDPANYALTMVFWLAVASAVAAGMVCLSHSQRWLESVALVVLMFVGLRSGLVDRETFNGQLFNDPVFFLMPLLTLFLYFHPNRLVARWLVPPLIALIALAGLIKFTFALLGFPIVVLIEITRASRRRFVPAYLLWYIVCTVTFFYAAGQRLENLPAYIATSLATSAGYSEAMQLSGDGFEAARFLACASCVLMLAAHAEWRFGKWRSGDWQGAPLLLGFMLFLFIAFKAGFVRHDMHSLIAWSSLTAGCAVYASRYLRIVSAPGWRLGMIALCVYVAGLAVSTHVEKTREPVSTLLDANVGLGLLTRASIVSDMLFGQRWPQLVRDEQQAWAALREQNPLPRLPGTVDIYPWNAAVPLAHHLDYVPRPVYQSYVVYNAPLMALNRRHLEGERAAATLVFDIETIDDRFLPLDEGRLWPNIIAHYDPAGMTSGHLLLRRRAVARHVEFRELGDFRASWWTPLAVPAGPALTWATIEIDKTLFGRLSNVLFKLPPIQLMLTLENGRQQVHRLVPDQARQGFLLSPIVDRPVKFDQLIRDDTALGAPQHRVRSLQLQGPEDVASFYRESIRVTFQALTFEAFVPPASTAAPGTSAPTSMAR